MSARGLRLSRCSAALLLPLLVLGGCKDEREAQTGPEITALGGDVLFQAALASSQILSFLNRTAEWALTIADSTLPRSQSSCEGDGHLTATQGAGGPGSLDFRFTGSFSVECGTMGFLTIHQDSSLDAAMNITFLETSPGLRYRVTLPFNWAEGQAEGPTFEFQDLTGATISALVTTPGHPPPDARMFPYGMDGFIECELAGSGKGRVLQSGTLRLEDRSQSRLFVEELAIEYTYDPELSPRFATWPAGSYELGAFLVGQFNTQAVTMPTEVRFDGSGGATFRVGDILCEANLATLENPCTGL